MSDPVKISLAPSGKLALHLESHTVYLPFTAKGMTCLRTVLTARAARPQDKIGTRASPTQWDIDQWLRRHSLVAELGLDIELTL